MEGLMVCCGLEGSELGQGGKVVNVASGTRTGACQVTMTRHCGSSSLVPAALFSPFWPHHSP
jgi:hypothetical protein